MLHIIKDPKQLPYGALMEIYAQSIADAATRDYPGWSENEGRLQAEQDLYSYLYHDFFSLPDAVCVLLTEKGKQLGVLRLEPYRDGMLITGLETHPSMRNRGVAKKLVKGALCYLQEKGIEIVYSHIARDNLPSLAVHCASGFMFSEEGAVCLDGTKTQDMDTYCAVLQHV